LSLDFLRRCEVEIGPLADWQGGGGGDGVRIVADGTNERLRVAFNSVKTLTGDPNKCELSIYNLGVGLRQAMRGELLRVMVLAGFEGADPSLVAYGALQESVSTRMGADIVTKLVVLDGYGGMVRGVYSRSWSGGSLVSRVVEDVAKTMPGVTVGRVTLPGTLAQKGASLVGSATSQLNRLADQFGFSWSVQDGVFQAVPDSTTSGSVHVFDADVNLLGAAPKLDGTSSGVEIIGRFAPGVKPGDIVRVRSRVAPDLSGDYKASSVALDFDSHGPAGIKIQAFKP
jgi:hypothetical protein